MKKRFAKAMNSLRPIKTSNNWLTSRQNMTSCAKPCKIFLFFSTGIPVCILVLKKCKKYDDVLFINAAQHFDKGKRQNSLRRSDIEKIVETYQHRKEEQRYARRVAMDEIRENDYNLNISRYVSTATPEEPVDLSATQRELKAIEQKINEAKDRHNKF